MKGEGRTSFWIAAAFALIVAAFPFQEHVSGVRRAGGYRGGMPGEYASMMFLGGFRGIAVDALWMRVQSLEREGAHYETLALCRLIGELQPHFEEAWLFNAWNMCQNIARKAGTDEERWEWTRSAVEFLEEGRKRNPGSWDMVHLEGWIFEWCVGRSEFMRKKAEEEFGLNHHELAIQRFRRHAEFGDDAVSPPYRRCAGNSYRSWAEDLRREAELTRQRRENAVKSRDFADSVALFNKELLLLRRALARYRDAQNEWADVVRMARGRMRGMRFGSAGVWESFAVDTEKLMDEVQRSARETEDEIKAAEKAMEEAGSRRRKAGIFRKDRI